MTTPSTEHPVLLDLTGHGINIAELNRSTKFLDANGTGLSHRTAWAGAGTGVLFYDPNSTGQITQKNQYVFTEWDKTAKGDLEALLNVFDSNGDGKLDAADAKFGLFKVMVTNADGTSTAHTLTDLGITSINLKADLTNITYADGSKISGETTFTKSDGSTGTVANMSLATETQGHAVTSTSATDANGTVSVTSTGLNADGSKAFVDTSSTSADGSAITNTYDSNGDGVVDHIQVITTSTDANGTRTETITNTNGGHVLLDSIQTITSGDGTNVTINRDTTGGGWYNQSEQRATSADGHRSVVVTQLSADGHEVVSSTTTVSADGFTQSIGSDLTSDGVADRIANDVIVINADSTRTTMVPVNNNRRSISCAA